MAKPAILWLTPERGQLQEASALTEYDAVILDPSWNTFRRGLLGADSPSRVDVPTGLVQIALHEVTRRSEELEYFLRQGGLFIVRQSPYVALCGSDLPFAGVAHVEVDNWQWWMLRAVPARTSVAPTPSRGRIEIREPSHPLAGYLRSQETYSSVLPRETAAGPDRIVLASNRGGEPLAVEFTHKGRFVLLGAGIVGGDDLLQQGVEAMLSQQRRAAQTWRSRAAHGLTSELARLKEEAQTRQRELEDKLAQEERRSEAFLERKPASDAMAYFTSGASSTGDPRKTASDLYSMLELIEEDVVPKGRRLWQVLAVREDDVKALGKFANHPPYHTRHVSAEREPPNITPVEAVELAGRILRAYLDKKYGEEL